MSRGTRITTALTAGVALASCSNEPAPRPSPGPAATTGSAAARATDAAPPGTPAAIRDDEAARLVRAGASCPLTHGYVGLDCPARKAATRYAFEHQQSVDVAATCVALLRDPDKAVRFTAAACLFDLTSVAVTPLLGAGLDALEAEPDPLVRKEIAWGLGDAEAVTAGLATRVLSLIERMAASPVAGDDDTAGNLLGTLFPEYMMDSAPRPPPEAQALVLAAIARPGGGLFIRALDKVRLVEDKVAACAAMRGALRPDSAEWWRVAYALADLKDACVAEIPHAMDVALERAAAGDPNVEVMKHLDRRFPLERALRSRIAKELRASAKLAPEWKRTDILAAATTFTAPPAER